MGPNKIPVYRQGHELLQIHQLKQNNIWLCWTRMDVRKKDVEEKTLMGPILLQLDDLDTNTANRRAKYMNIKLSNFVVTSSSWKMWIGPKARINIFRV